MTTRQEAHAEVIGKLLKRYRAKVAVARTLQQQARAGQRVREQVMVRTNDLEILLDALDPNGPKP